MDQFHLEDVFGRRVQFCVPKGDGVHLQPNEISESLSAQLMDHEGDILCKLFVDMEKASNTSQLYLGYELVQNPRVHVRIVEGTKKLRFGSFVKIHPSTTIACIIERLEEKTSVLIAI